MSLDYATDKQIRKELQYAHGVQWTAHANTSATDTLKTRQERSARESICETHHPHQRHTQHWADRQSRNSSGGVPAHVVGGGTTTNTQRLTRSMSSHTDYSHSIWTLNAGMWKVQATNITKGRGARTRRLTNKKNRKKETRKKNKVQER
jgi:hypothetical protein